MAADGAWDGKIGAWRVEQGRTRTRQALEQLSGVLDQLERRLTQAPSLALRADVVDSLVETLNELAQRVAAHERETSERQADLGAALQRLTERLDGGADEGGDSAPQIAGSEGPGIARPEPVQAGVASPPRPEEPWALRATLALAIGAAALSLMGAAVLVVGQTPAAKAISPPAPTLTTDLPLRPSLAPETPSRVTSDATLSLPPQTNAAGPRPETFETVAAALAAGETTALARLTGLAQRGEVRAQLQLAALYDSGAAGLPRDLTAARLWTRKAAEAGQRIAMHNLALFLMQGDGGDRDVEGAATWFRRAADLGVVDSQYNLGLLYEAGRGVPLNLREAYRWFSVAANAGDLTSRAKALALEPRLANGERAELDREAARFQPGALTTADPGDVLPPATTLAETQTLLARQGYYVGPVDGVPSSALKAATRAYLRDRASATAPTSGTSP